MLPDIKKAAITTIAALSLAIGAAAPAAAWGQREQDTLKGAVGALLLKAIIDDARRDRAPTYRSEPYRQSYYGHVIPNRPAPSIYSTPAAQAFNSYSHAERRLIQRRLAYWGYYRGAVDGSFGPGTYSAVVAFARDQGYGRGLGSAADAFGVYDGLIY